MHSLSFCSISIPAAIQSSLFDAMTLAKHELKIELLPRMEIFLATFGKTRHGLDRIMRLAGEKLKIEYVYNYSDSLKAAS